MSYLATVSHRRSEHAAVFLRLAAQRGVPPAAVVAVSVFNLKRIKAKLRAAGPGAFRRQLAKFRSPLKPSPLSWYMREQGWPADSNLPRLCGELGIPFHTVHSVNGPEILSLLDRRKFDFVVYLGGGILRTPFIEKAGGLVLNAHDGPLPQVRGMNASEWSVYLNLGPSVSVHSIDRGIDTGQICFSRPVTVQPGWEIEDLRGASTLLGVQMLVEAIELHNQGILPRLPNPPQAGRQYFVMHPFLLEIARKRLRRFAGNNGRENLEAFFDRVSGAS